MTPTPIYTRMYKVQEVFGVSPDTVRRMAKRGAITIRKIGRCSVVRTDEMQAAFNEACGAECGAEKQ